MCYFWAGPALCLRIAGLAQSMDYPIVILICGCCYSGWTRDRREGRQVRLAPKTDSNVAVVGGDDKAADKSYRRNEQNKPESDLGARKWIPCSILGLATGTLKVAL